MLDLIIIGAGPAGLSASLYASRYGVSHKIIGQILGGQISETHLMDNYLGIEDINGYDFSQRAIKHIQKYGAEIVPEKVIDIQKKEKDVFEVILEKGKKIKAKNIILATGRQRRLLGARGEEKFKGKGVSYCATCDGFFYKNKTVGVIGGGNSAAAAALYLADISQKVYIIYRREKLPAEFFWVEKIKKNPKIEIIFKNTIQEFLGDEYLEKVLLEKEYKKQKELALEGVFVEIGSEPSFFCVKNLNLKRDKSGYIKIQKNGATSVSGVFAAGDNTDGSDKFCQVVTATAEGAIAARSVFKRLQKGETKKTETVTE